MAETQVGVTDDFAALVQPHLPTLTWLAARLAPGEHEDVVQEALTRAWRKRAQFDPGRGSARAWLCAVLASQARRVVRRPPGVPVRELIVQPPDSAARIDLGRALDVLTDRQRLAVDCHYLVALRRRDRRGDAVLGRHREVHSLRRPAPVASRTQPHGSSGGRIMSTPFDGEARRQDDERDDFAPRISEEEQGIDALLRAGGEQWRSAVPAVEFDRPSSRVAMLGRGPRVVVSLGIAAAVVAIVLAGSALVGRPAASVGPQAPTGGTSAVPTAMNSAADSSTSLGTVRTLTELTVDFRRPAAPDHPVTLPPPRGSCRSAASRTTPMRPPNDGWSAG
ncbi:MAG: sigma-70 family RNA polymerase sigma factor [Nakamurella sp.]